MQGKEHSDSEGSSPLTVTSRVCMYVCYFLFIFNFLHSFNSKLLFFFFYDFRFCVCWETSLLDLLLCSHNGFNQFVNELPIIVPLDFLALLPLSPFGLFHTTFFLLSFSFFSFSIFM